jgi:short subunit dehydrogenase-like uncharacterized protein
MAPPRSVSVARLYRELYRALVLPAGGRDPGATGVVGASGSPSSPAQAPPRYDHAMANAVERDLDLVLWGATGYTGRLVARYLAQRTAGLAPGDPERFAWEIGGRDRAKLEALRAELSGVDPAARELPLLVGDSLDPASLAPIVRRTRVVATTVGPYSRYGTPLARLCAELGTDSCDLSGEVAWMRRTVGELHQPARASGARIVHCCGFDSIPSDLGTLLLHDALERQGAALRRARLRVRSLRGKASGGTVASLFEIVGEARRDPETRRALLDPYALNPPGERQGPDRNEGLRPRLDADRGVWTAPFLMAMINTRVVRRSNALLGYLYGRDFRYDERVDTGRGIRGRLRARAVSSAIGAFMGGAAFGPTAWFLRRFLLPNPGEGPSPEERERGEFRIRIFGDGTPAAESGLARSAVVTVAADSDPGYGATAGMLAESALALVEGWRAGSRGAGGVLTPASALGLPLVERLGRAGVTFATEPVVGTPGMSPGRSTPSIPRR